MTPDVVCIGLATQDTVVPAPRWPVGDDRVVASAVVRAGGGPAATAAVTFARLGVRTLFVSASIPPLAAFVHERALPDALAFANECAALSCRALDGRSAIPRLEEVGA